MTATRSVPWRTSRRSSKVEAASRRERILLRGSTFFGLCVTLAALFLLAPLLRGIIPGLASLSGAAVAVAAGAVVRRRWWVLRVDRATLDAALVRSCRMVLAVPTVTAEGVRVQLARTLLEIGIRSFGRNTFQLVFAGDWRAERKARLVQSVVAKQLEPLLPRIRIRFRRQR